MRLWGVGGMVRWGYGRRGSCNPRPRPYPFPNLLCLPASREGRKDLQSSTFNFQLPGGSRPQPWPWGSSRGRGLAYGCLLATGSRVEAADGCNNVNFQLSTSRRPTDTTRRRSLPSNTTSDGRLGLAGHRRRLACAASSSSTSRRSSVTRRSPPSATTSRATPDQRRSLLASSSSCRAGHPSTRSGSAADGMDRRRRTKSMMVQPDSSTSMSGGGIGGTTWSNPAAGSPPRPRWPPNRPPARRRHGWRVPGCPTRRRSAHRCAPALHEPPDGRLPRAPPP